jgi:hypothetical protein
MPAFLLSGIFPARGKIGQIRRSRRKDAKAPVVFRSC